jgi:hypothetical protein
MKRIQLTQGKVALVSDNKFENINKIKWCANFINGYWYAVAWYQGKMVSMHRFVAGEPKGKLVDHRNHNTLDNQDCNLRVCTRAQNCQNQGKCYKSSSKYKGLYWRKDRKRWEVEIRANNKRHRLGRFVDELDAARAYDVAAKKLHGEFARPNF